MLTNDSSLLPFIEAEPVFALEGGSGGATRIRAQLDGAEVKIEISPVTRGVVHDPERRAVSPTVEDEFGYAAVQVVSFEDLFGGKLHAAVDRQHPRPTHELLAPGLSDLNEPYVRDFVGMTTIPISIDELEATRVRLIADIRGRLCDNIVQFLLSLHDGEPDFGTIGLPQAQTLPAVRWKLFNLKKLAHENAAKHAAQRVELENLFRNS